MYLQFNKNIGKAHEDSELWTAFCAFHLGEYKKALDVGYSSDNAQERLSALRDNIYERLFLSVDISEAFKDDEAGCVAAPGMLLLLSGHVPGSRGSCQQR